MRLNKIHRTFEKGYVPGWTEEVFMVHRVVPGPVPTYKISEWDDTPVQGTFYDADLQKLHLSDQALFRIEKVLKRQKDRWWVKWKGWPDKYNSWIARGDVTSLRQPKTKKASTKDTRRKRQLQWLVCQRRNHDVGSQFLVLRDVDESRQYPRVSPEPSPSFQKPFAICGTRLACGHGECVLTDHSEGGGTFCQPTRTFAVRAMARMPKTTKETMYGGINVAN